MSFCLLNIPFCSKSPTYKPYRLNRLITLIFLGVAILSHCPLALCEDSNTDWPEPVYFPQTPQPPSVPQAVTGGNPAGTNGNTDKKSDHKKGIWPFKSKKDKAKPLTNAQITKVGPKDPPPSPYPLLRLSMPIDTGAGIVAPGIYLVKPTDTKTDPNTTSLAGKTLALTRQNKPVLVFKIHAVQAVDDNIELTGTPSPLSKTSEKAALTPLAETQISADQKSLIIVIKEGKTRLESDPFPISIDKRHILTF